MSAHGSAWLRSVSLKSLRDQRRALLGWGIALALLGLMMASFYPTLREEGEKFQEIAESYPPALRALFGDLSDLATPEGFLRAELFSAMLPVLFLVFAIGRASDTLAGEEERGGIDLLLSLPLSRRRVLLEKAGGVAGGIAVMAFCVWLPLWLGALAFDMPIGADRLAAASVMLALLALLFAALALAVAALRGRKALALGVTSGVAVASYLVDSLASLVSWLEPLERVSPFYYYGRGDPLVGGMPWGDAAVLVALTVALLGLALWGFERRDLGV